MNDYTSHVAGNITATPISQSIIIPPSSAIPTFSGKYSKRPNQFLIRVQEYAETVHGWDQTTLLRGISQFSRDTALEWHCQLRAHHRQPETWVEFADTFLSQFNSPIRSALQEQEWYECKQRENETISEFLVRLRSIWMEQKSKETEVDVVRHLLCKMRSDLLIMIGVSHGASLDEIIFEAQKLEEILYLRNKDGNRLHIYYDEEINASFNKCKESLPSETRQLQVEVDEVGLQLATMEEQTQQQIKDSFKRTENPSKDEEYVSNSFWFEGTESWHIHEVKPQ